MPKIDRRIIVEPEPRYIRNRGGIYCGPDCGMGCTRESYNDKRAHLSQLIDQLGKGWTGRMWDNLGWHWEAISPCRRIHVSYNETHGVASRWSASIQRAGDFGILWHGYGRTPDAAIKRAIADLESKIGQFIDLLSAFKDLTKGESSGKEHGGVRRAARAKAAGKRRS